MTTDEALTRADRGRHVLAKGAALLTEDQRLSREALVVLAAEVRRLREALGCRSDG